ncbi:head-tail connector protein [Xenophilus azovorans]|uniref:head-tail connector protein n=1 Tax=Xenophilus azovorans TaxID=151755 RepID=UPI00316AC508
MSIIDLEEAKLHLRVDQDEEDAAIQAMINAAEAAVLDYLNLEELPEAAPVHAAALMLVGSLYMNRESQSDRPIIENRLFTRLLDPYRAMEA